MKRKREKIEKDIKKKEEEQRETLLMKKRLEFLIRQSDIYANFMAKKLGIMQEEGKQEVQPGEEKVEIDENLAKKRVQDMINSHLEGLRAFDQETQAMRIERGGPAGVVSQANEVQEEELENIASNRFDDPDSMLTRMIDPPKMFQGGLKEYQLKGLRWLDNLHEQAINGILADEMVRFTGVIFIGIGKDHSGYCVLGTFGGEQRQLGTFPDRCPKFNSL